MASPAKTALPIGGALHVDPGFRGGLKTLDAPRNPHAKFAGRAPPRSNISTVFSAQPEPVGTPRAGRRSVAQEERKEDRPQAKRVTNFEATLQERARQKEENPRPLRKSAEKPAAAKEEKVHDIATAGGVAHAGGKQAVAGAPKRNETTYNKPQAETPARDYASMERFRLTPKPAGGNVLRPDTLPEPVVNPKDQRFACRPKQTASCAGVFKAEPVQKSRAAQQHKVTPPFFTES